MDELISRLKDAKHVMFITGAGVSTASGLPTYRGVGGVYTDDKSLIPPEILMSKAMWKIRPQWVWDHLHKIYAASQGAEPNAAHDAIVMMEALIDKITIVTQNVDGLHRKAGSDGVIELHGSADSLFCEKCGHKEVPDDFSALPNLPKCPECNHVLRPPVVLFGENLPEMAINSYQKALDSKPDVIIAIGTTGNFPYIVEPMRFVKEELGGFTAVIDPILSDNFAPYTDAWINESAEIALPKLAGALPAC